MAQLVKNITSIRYFLDKHNIIDNSYDINMNYHPKVPSQFTSNPTFVAEFNFDKIFLVIYFIPFNF